MNKQVFFSVVVLLCLLMANAAFGGLSSFTSALPPVRYAGNPVIATGTPYTWSAALGGGIAAFEYAGEPTVLVNPSDPTQLLIFVSNGNGVVRGTAPRNDPYHWSNWTGVFRAQAGSWDSAYVRKANIWAEGTTLYMSYSGDGDGGGLFYEKIGMATSTDSGLTWARHGFPTLTASEDDMESSVMCGNIEKVDGTYYMYYVYFYGASLGSRGMRVATSSSPFGPWTRGVDVLPHGAWEYHQILRLDDGTFVMTFEYPLDLKNIDVGGQYAVGIATNTVPNTAFTVYGGNPIFSKVGSTAQWDSAQAATAAWTVVDGKWMLFYQGGEGTEKPSLSHWQMGIADISYTENTVSWPPLPAPPPHRLKQGGNQRLKVGGVQRLK